jgi:hypothetical protein
MPCPASACDVPSEGLLRSGLKVRSTLRLITRSAAMRANSIGPPCSAAFVRSSAAVSTTGVQRSDEGMVLTRLSYSLAQGRQLDAVGELDRLGKTLIPGHTQLCNRTSFGIRSWTGNESIPRNPSGVPILDSCTAHGAFKAADLARLYDMFAAVINRAAFTGPVT